MESLVQAAVDSRQFLLGSGEAAGGNEGKLLTQLWEAKGPVLALEQSWSGRGSLFLSREHSAVGQREPAGR